MVIGHTIETRWLMATPIFLSYILIFSSPSEGGVDQFSCQQYLTLYDICNVVFVSFLTRKENFSHEL